MFCHSKSILFHRNYDFVPIPRYKFRWRPVHSDQKISKLINERKYIPYGWVNLFLFFFLFLLKEKLQLQSLTDEYKAISKINLSLFFASYLIINSFWYKSLLTFIKGYPEYTMFFTELYLDSNLPRAVIRLLQEITSKQVQKTQESLDKMGFYRSTSLPVQKLRVKDVVLFSQ